MQEDKLFFSKIERYGTKLNSETFGLMISCHKNCNDTSEAIGSWKMMELLEVKPNVVRSFMIYHCKKIKKNSSDLSFFCFFLYR